MDINILRNMTPVSACNFLAKYPERGGIIDVRQFGMRFYSINDVQVFGKGTSLLCAKDSSDGSAWMLKESVNEDNFYIQQGLLQSIAAAVAEKPDLIVLDEVVALNSIHTPLNFWHWIFESISKLLVLETYGYSGPYIVPDDCTFINGIFDILSIPQDRIIRNSGAYHVKKLIVPQRYQCSQLVTNKKLTKLIRCKLLEGIKILDGAKHCYIKRIGERRRVENEDEVLRLLSFYDFEVMVPEDYSVGEQLSFMTNVSCSIMPHGANCALALLQPEKSTFIEIFNHAYIAMLNMHIVLALNLRYHMLSSDTPYSGGLCPTDYLQKGHSANITVNINLLRAILENLLGRPTLKKS